LNIFFGAPALNPITYLLLPTEATCMVDQTQIASFLSAADKAAK
jgi:hypothetical protein